MQNRTLIINTALMRMSANGVNLAFQDTPVAQAAEAAWSRCLNYCLSLYPWSFAVRYALLARGADAPAFGWRYAYPLPGDCVRVLDVRRHDAGGIPSSLVRMQPGPRYEIAGRNIHTDAESLALRYVSNNSDIVLSELFADALAWRIAFEVAPYAAQGGANAQNCFQLFEQAVDRARTEEDAQAVPVRKVWPSRFLSERRVD